MSEHWSETLLRIAKAVGVRGVQARNFQNPQGKWQNNPKEPPKPSGSKLATKIGKVGTGLLSGQQGQKIGDWAGGQARQAGGVLREFVQERAGAGGGQTQQPQQSGADQEMFQQQASRRKGSGLTSFDRRRTADAFRSQQQPGKTSPQNVQSRAVPQMKSFNPALASLLAVSAGFAASDAVVNAAGARGQRDITDDQLRLFETMANKKRRGKRLRKEHSPLPPIQGLVWDEGAKRWRKPENVGKTASEVQGKKRIRGSALGQTAKTPGGTGAGKGRGREFSRGRAQRIASGDIGVAGVQGKAPSRKRKRRRAKR